MCYSVLSRTRRYFFGILHNALTLLRSVISYIIYCTGHIGAVIASHCYCSKLIHRSALLLLFIIAFLLLFTCFSL
jgi:hypothetical protein